MSFSRDKLMRIMLVAFAFVLIIPIVVTLSFSDIYRCVGNSSSLVACSAVERARYKIDVGIAFESVALAIFIASVGYYVYLSTKTNRAQGRGRNKKS